MLVPRRNLISNVTVTFLLVLVPVLWYSPLFHGDYFRIWNDTDSVYHLKQIESCLEHYPSLHTFDSFSHFPEGNQVHWPPLHAFAYASILKLVGSTGNVSLDIYSLSWIPVVQGLLFLFLLFRISGVFIVNLKARLFICLAYTFSLSSFSHFIFGAIDHHGFAVLGVMIAIYGFLRKSPGSWFLGFFILSALTTEILILGTILLFCLFISQYQKQSKNNNFDPFPLRWYLIPSLAMLIATVLSRWISLDHHTLLDFDWEFPSLFHVFWFLILGLISSMQHRIFKIFGNKSSDNQTLITVLYFICGAFITVSFLWISGQGEAVIKRLMLDQRMLVGEEQSIFQISSWEILIWRISIVFSFGFSLIRLIYCWFEIKVPAVFQDLTKEFRTATGQNQSFFWWFCLIAAIFAAKEIRFLLIFWSILSLDLFIWITALCSHLMKKRRFLGYGVLYLLTGLLLGPSIYMGIHFRALEAKVSPDLLSSLNMFKWVKDETPNPFGHEGQLLYGIWAPWEMGHHLNFLGKRPVAIDPFNHQSINEDGILTGVHQKLKSVFQEKSLESLLKVLKGQRMEYLILEKVPQQYAAIPEFRQLKYTVPFFHYDPLLLGFPLVRMYLEPFLYPFYMYRLEWVSDQLDAIFIDGEFLTEEGTSFRPPLIQVYRISEKKVNLRIKHKSEHSGFLLCWYVAYRGRVHRVCREFSSSDSGDFCVELYAPAPSNQVGFSLISNYQFFSMSGEYLGEVGVTERDLQNQIELEFELENIGDDFKSNE